MKTTRLTLASIILLICSAFSVLGEEHSDFTQQLDSYLHTLDIAKEDEEAILRTLRTSQVIKLIYEDNPASEKNKSGKVAELFDWKSIDANQAECGRVAAAFIVDEAGEWIQTSDHIPYHSLRVVFNQMTESSIEIHRHWLEEMKKPLDEGYYLKSVSLVQLPDRKIQMKSMDLCQDAMKELAKEIMVAQAEFSQLQDFEISDCVDFGDVEKGTNKFTYPGLSYSWHLTPIRSSKYPRKDAADWCALNLRISRDTGTWGARVPTGHRAYPNQGIIVKWNLRSDNECFNEKLSFLIQEFLKPLEDFETELINE